MIKNINDSLKLVRKNNKAFTIVELLMVVVIIGILAAITIVSYTGITKRAGESSVQAELSNASKKLAIYYTLNGTYPTSIDQNTGCPTAPVVDSDNCIKFSSGTSFSYNFKTASTYGLSANKGSVGYIITESSSSVAFTPSFVKAWGGTSSDIGNDLIQTNDGGYAITGYTASYGAGSYDMFLAKYDANGNLNWNKTWGGAGIDYGNSLIQTSDGGYTISGRTTSFGAGNYDTFLVRYDASGNLSWNKTWGGTNTDYGYGLIQTSDGGYAITGYTQSYGAGVTDTFLVKYDASGNLSWNKTWGGANADFGTNNLIQTSDGGYVITGYTASFGAGSNDMLIVKFDTSGNLSWNKTWGGASTDYGHGITKTSDDGFVITGNTSSYGAGDNDMLIVKFDTSGNLIWNKTWGGAGSDAGRSLIHTNDDSFVITGDTTSYGAGNNDIFLVKFDTSSNLSWNKTWGGAGIDYGYDLVQTTYGGYAVVGSTKNYGAGNDDMILAKYDASGNINNCASPMCQTPTATIKTPSATITTPSATITTPSATVTAPTATVTTPTATVTTVVAP